MPDSQWMMFRGQSNAAVTRPHCNVRDVGLTPAATRNENGYWETPPKKVAQWSGQDLSGRPAMLS